MSAFSETPEVLAVRRFRRRANRLSHTAHLSDSFSQPLLLGQQIVQLHITARDRREVLLELCRNRLKGLQHFIFSF